MQRVNSRKSSTLNFLKQLTKNLRQLKPAETFLLLGFVFGLMFLILTPPMQVPDEPQHFYRAYQVSEFHFVPSNVSSGYGGIIPNSVVEVATQLKGNIPGNDSNKVTLSLLKNASKVPLDPSVQSPTRFDNSAVNSPVVYFPQAFGVGVGRLLRLNPFWLIYLGRLCNLFAWLILIYLAIRIVPFGKWAFTAIALIPVSLSQVASLSSDAMQISVLALVTACILKAIVDRRKWHTHHIVLLAVLFIVGLSLLKAAYLPLILLIFLIPRTAISRWLQVLIGAVACTIAISWSLTVLPMAKTVPNYLGLPATINSSKQVSFIKHHPKTFISTLAANMFGPPNSAALPSYLGSFGWQDTTLPYWIQTIILLTLVAAFIYRSEEESSLKNLSIRLRVCFGLLILISLTLLYSLLYIGYTPVKATIIQGVQGRYFIPLTFLAVPVVAQSVVQLKIKRPKFSQAMLVLLSFGLVSSLVTILIRFY